MLKQRLPKKISRWHLIFVLLCLVVFGHQNTEAQSSQPVEIPTSPVDLEKLPPALVELNELMASSASFKARFIRSVYVKGSKTPVSTQGRLVFDTELGLLWQVLDPYKEALWLSRDGVFYLSSNGKEKIFEDPGVFGKVQEFVEGRYKDLAANGELSFGDLKGRWEMRMDPQSGTLAGRVVEIRLRGFRGLLSWVRIQEKDETVTSIRVYDLQRYEHSLGEPQFFYLEPREDFLPLQ